MNMLFCIYAMQNEYKQLFNILKMFYCFSTEQNTEVGTLDGYHSSHSVRSWWNTD